MSQARYDADFFAVNVQNEVGEKNVNELDEFLSPEEAQYLRTNETSQYTLGSLFENAVPVSRKSRRKPGQTAVTCRPCPVCEVEFPESVLEEHVESCLHLSESQQNPAQASQAGPSGSGRESDGSLPEELLESFLQMQLPPEASDVFWSAYEFNLNERQRGVQDAFLAALEEALSWIPDEGSSTCSRDEALEVSKDICFAGEGTDLQRPSVASDPMDPGASRSRDAPKSRWARRGRTDVTDVTDDRNDRMEDVEDVEDLEDQREVPASQSPGASESLERMAEMDGPQESAQDRISRLKKEAKARKTKSTS